MTLNIQATTSEQGRIKEYLENNASDALAEKINHGVPIEQDGLKLLNLKTLDGFMEYANKEAQSVASKGARSVFIDDDTVFGWAVHYFEEDSIIGKLYNPDGTKYQPPKPKTTVKHTPAPAIKVEPPKPVVKPQISMFDLIDTAEEPIEETPEVTAETPSINDTTGAINKTATEDEDTEEVPTVSKLLKEVPSIGDSTPPIPVKQDKPASQGSSVYQSYMKVQNKYPDYIVAYRLGDFYEVFGDNAIDIASELDLTLTGKDCGLNKRVPMVGFPYHIADKYFSRIAGKYNLVIADGDTNIRVFNARETDDEEIDEELTCEDMRAFDGDIKEPDDLSDEDTDDDFMKYVDTEAVAVIYDLLGDMLDIQ